MFLMVAMQSHKVLVFMLVWLVFPSVIENCAKKKQTILVPHPQAIQPVRPKEDPFPCKCYAYELSCESQKLTTLSQLDVPPSFCTNASVLNLRSNELTRLDFPVGASQQYIHATLLLDRNKLVSLEGLQDWSGTKLVVNNNLINSVDVSPFKEHLEELYIGVNLLSTINLATMTNLRVLSAGSNNLSNVVLPAEKCSLRLINLDDNKLSSLPRGLENCEDLVELQISRNELTVLDISKNIRLLKLSAQGNSVRQLIVPLKNCSLIVVDVNDNGLTSVPDSLVQCSQLRILSIQNNTMSSFPRALLQFVKLRLVSTAKLDENDTLYSNNSLGIQVNLEENPISFGEILTSFRDYVTSQGFLFYYFINNDFFINSPVDCDCSEITLDQFVPVTYCISSMCEDGENLWKHL